MTPELWTFLKDLTLGGWAVLALVLGAKRVWYFGYTVDDLRKEVELARADRDRFLTMLLMADEQADAAINVGEQIASRSRFTGRQAG